MNESLKGKIVQGMVLASLPPPFPAIIKQLVYQLRKKQKAEQMEVIKKKDRHDIYRKAKYRYLQKDCNAVFPAIEEVLEKHYPNLFRRYKPKDYIDIFPELKEQIVKVPVEAEFWYNPDESNQLNVTTILVVFHQMIIKSE